MDLISALTNGVITVLNGLWSILDLIFSPLTIVILALAASFAWLALLERDELDRQGTKPDIGRGQ